MGKSKIFRKVDNSTMLKALIAALLIIIIEVVCGTLILNIYTSQVYAEVYAERTEIASDVAAGAKEVLGENADYADESVQTQLKDYFAVNLHGDGCVLFTEASSGRIVGSGWILEGNLSNYGITYSSPCIFDMNGTPYIFSAARLNDSYFIGVIDNFQSRQSQIDGLIANTVVFLIVCAIFVVAVFIFYVNWAGGQMSVAKHAYRFSVDGDNKVVRYNHKFRADFGALNQLDFDISKFDNRGYNLISINGANGEKTLSFTVRKMADGKYSVRGDEIKNSVGSTVNVPAAVGVSGSADKVRISLSAAYKDFINRGKRTLIGIIYIINLQRIGALFGKDMSLKIQRALVERAKSKFEFAYELDTGRLGVASPDGQKLNNLLASMDEVIDYLNQPIKLEDNLFTIETKCGFALCDATMPSGDFEYAMQAAEAALQRVLDSKVADYLIYHELQKNVYAKYFIKFDVRQMLDDGAFEMEYQPQYNIKEGRIEGFEALLRVKKNWDVSVDTFSFISYAERTGAMVQLGDFIFNTGMSFAKQVEDKNVRVSLNVSPVQLMQAGFTETFLNIFKKYNLKPGSVCVEITESFLMSNFDETLEKLKILKDNGISIHLDDFGTEYSSLLYIKKLPVSSIKIDKGFVHGICKDKTSQAIIKFITNIAKLIDCTTICEGVESTQEFDMLQVLGCDVIQGWLIGRSLPPEKALAVIDTFDYETVAAAQNARSVPVSGDTK